MLYSISQAAAKINVSTYTLRYYDKEGLLPMIERNQNGVRIFKEEDFAWLRLIDCLKASGMPIKEIKQYIDLAMEGDSTLEQRRNMFYERKAVIEQQMAELQKTLNSVKYKCWFYDTALAAGSSEVPQNMAPEDIPPEILELKNNSSLYGKCGK
ncbi:MAG: MerR family transcriptional regulator [Bacillota bacterium]|jgi:DNA-binding transcriptional MerR regulator